MNKCTRVLIAFYISFSAGIAGAETATKNCIDGFCIGQSIHSDRFDEVPWLTPKDRVLKSECQKQACRSDIEFPGYAPDVAAALLALPVIDTTWVPLEATLITNTSLAVLRKLRYDCTRPARRVVGIFRSSPSGHLTYVGLRISPEGLRVFRVARDFPYHNVRELNSLAEEVNASYGGRLLIYPGDASNATSDVIHQKKDGWFGFIHRNSADPSDNIAELVLIDPATRHLLISSSELTAGEINLIQPLWYQPYQCIRRVPLQ